MKEELNQRIFDAAIDEMIAKGLEGASMDSISKAAQVSKRTLYKYYSSKHDLFDAIIDQQLNSLEEYVVPNFMLGMDFESQIDSMIDTKLRLLTSANYIRTSKLLISELLKNTSIDERTFLRFNQFEQGFIHWIDLAKKEGKVTTDLPSEIIANQFHSIIKGQIYYPIIFGIKEVNAELVQVTHSYAKQFFLTAFCKNKPY